MECYLSHEFLKAPQLNQPLALHLLGMPGQWPLGPLNLNCLSQNLRLPVFLGFAFLIRQFPSIGVLVHTSQGYEPAHFFLDNDQAIQS